MRALTLNILTFRSRPALSSLKEERDQMRHHGEHINPRLHTECSI